MNKWLDGYKSRLAGIGGILAAVGYFLSEGLKDGLQLSDIVTLLGGVAAGLAVLGLAGKLNKVIEALGSLGK